MARTDSLNNYLTDVAKAIKDKKDDQTPIKASEFDKEIANLPSGGGGGESGETYEPKIIFSKYNEYGCPTKAYINYNYSSQNSSDVNILSNMDTDLLRIQLYSNTYPHNGRNFLAYIEEIEINTDRINSIGARAFEGLYSLKRITNMTDFKNLQIGDYAFNNCEALETIDLSKLTGRIGLPDNNASICNVFYNCKSLTNVVFPEDTSNIIAIGVGTFDGCSLLNMDYIPNTVKDIYHSAFHNCTSLTLKELPSELKTINDYGFQNCSNLELSDLPNSINTIGLYTFANCTKITIKALPTQLTKMGSYCFQNCVGIQELTIDSQLPSISSYTFSGCSNLSKVIIKQNTLITMSSKNVFDKTPIANGTGYVYVPDDLVNAYKTATNWVTYADQIKPISELPEEG